MNNQNKQYDFGGWATVVGIKCSDGRIIGPDTFKHYDGKSIPLVWNHKHDSPQNVLGHGDLKWYPNKGLYIYGKFNASANAIEAKERVEHGDIRGLSILATNLKHDRNVVQTGKLHEVSLVLSGANPGALIDSVMQHSDDDGELAIITMGETLVHGENIEFYEDEQIDEKPIEENQNESKDSDIQHNDESDKKTVMDIFNEMTEEQRTVVLYLMDEYSKAMSEEFNDEMEQSDTDIVKVLDGMTDSQRKTVYELLDATKLQHSDNDEGGTNSMSNNLFETKGAVQPTTLSHADQEAIIALAKKTGSFKTALFDYVESNDTLKHAFSDSDVEKLFPEFENLMPGAPEIVAPNSAWVTAFMNKAHKSPISRVRTRQTDIRDISTLLAKGYKTKGGQKAEAGNPKLVTRTTDPTTVYVRDNIHKDDQIDIVDFDYVAYQFRIMRMMLDTTLAQAALFTDGRDDGEADKIGETHMRPIFGDDALYTIYRTFDFDTYKTKFSGAEGSKYFGDEYIYAEGILSEAMYGREDYRGSGALDMFCSPHTLNQMLLSRDMNGRRVYDSKADLAASMNVENIYVVENFGTVTRTTSDNKVMQPLAILVNPMDYNFGATRGGKVARYNQFDIDFNKEKLLIETRLSGALTRIKSAIVIEEDVTPDPPTQG